MSLEKDTTSQSQNKQRKKLKPGKSDLEFDSGKLTNAELMKMLDKQTSATAEMKVDTLPEILVTLRNSL